LTKIDADRRLSHRTIYGEADRNADAPTPGKHSLSASAPAGTVSTRDQLTAAERERILREWDELGYDQSVLDLVFHANAERVLQLLGLDHLKTTFLNNGRSERPTVVYGKVIQELLA